MQVLACVPTRDLSGGQEHGRVTGKVANDVFVRTAAEKARPGGEGQET